MCQGAFPLEELPLCRGAAAVRVLGYGAHRMWFSREQEALQTVQLREGGFSEFSKLQSLFLHSSGKACFKKASQMNQDFLLKNK